MAGGPTIFVSYKRGHEASLTLVTELEAALHREGFQVWRDVGIDPGERWSDELWRWLLECSGAVAVVSDEATKSDWCRREWSVLAARASHAGLRVVPVRVGQVDSKADILADIQAVRAGPRGTTEAVVARLQGLRAAPPRPADYLAVHAAWLRWLYAGAPALGREPFTLADVYVDTECGTLRWGELKEDRTIDPFAEPHGGRADLVETVLGYFGDPAFREPVVVQGPAGSGKSAFTLRLANRLLDEDVGVVPVVVRFRDLRLSRYSDVDELLKDAVRVAPAGEHPPAPTESLFGDDLFTQTTRFRDAEISSVVVILDGWDEVTLTGSTRFQQQIEEWLPRLREHFARSVGPPVRLLLTGRPSAAVDRSHFLRRNTPVLTIRPIRPDQLRTYATRISHHLAVAADVAATDRAADAAAEGVTIAVEGVVSRDAGAADIEPAKWWLDLSRCETAFARYETWFSWNVAARDTSVESLTAALSDGSTAGADTEVLGSPLLALLAFRTVAEWPGDTGELFDEPTALYHALVEVTTQHAGKAEPSPEGTVHRGGRTLRQLLQRVAAVITTQGGEFVSFDELHRRLGGDAALTDWAEAATSESTLHELVVNFYFKGHPELGCEFLHKSFREYLHAEAIVASLEMVSRGKSGPCSPPNRDDWGIDFTEGSAHHSASRALANLLAPEWFTPEVRTHVFWLVKRAATAEPERWTWVRDLLNDLWRWWVEGGHVRTHPGPQRWRRERLPPPVVEMIDDSLPRDDRPWMHSPSTIDMDAHLGDALLQLTSFVHVLLMGSPHAGSRRFQTAGTDIVRFRPFDYDPANLIARLASARHRPQGSGLVAAHLEGVDLSQADLRRVDLSYANLSHADLNGADVGDAILVGVDFDSANLHRTNFSRSNLEHAKFSGADLTGASLQHTNLPGVDLDSASLRHANLTAANLDSATLRHADLDSANLRHANLYRANLRHVNLRGANLRHTKVSGTNLRDADLSDANVANIHADDDTVWPNGFRPPDVL